MLPKHIFVILFFKIKPNYMREGMSEFSYITGNVGFRRDITLGLTSCDCILLSISAFYFRFSLFKFSNASYLNDKSRLNERSVRENP